jgi:uncharacterized OB-fold protein
MKTSTSLPGSWRRIKDRIPPGSEGTVLTWTQLVDAPDGYQEFAPYYLALVELADGRRVTAQIVDSKPSTGARVTACFRRMIADGGEGIIEYGIKFQVTP